MTKKKEKLTLTKEKRTYRLTFIEGLLGTKAGNKELLEDYIASKRPEGIDQDELDSMPEFDEELEKGSTLFCREEGVPFIYDYQVKGFFKDTQSALARAGIFKMSAFKKVIDGLIFPKPRKIRLNMPEGAEIGWCERPLRAQTMQGERISIARSEEVPPGTTLELTVMTMNPELWEIIELWLDYGEEKGLGRWRNSGKGRFTWERIED